MEKIRRQRREVLADSGVSTRGKERIGRFKDFDDEYGFGDRMKFKNFDANHALPMESIKSRPVSDQRGLNNSGPVSPCRPVGNTVVEQRFDRLHYHNEGPLRYDNSNHLYHEHDGKMRYNPGYNELARVKDLETDRAELIRKLDELKDKLTRSCDLTEESKERFGGNNRRMLSPTRPNSCIIGHHSPCAQEGYCCTHGAKTINPARYGNETPCLSQCLDSIPYPNNSYSANLRLRYPHERHFHEHLVYSEPQLPRRSPPHQSPSRYSHSPYNHGRFVLPPHENVSYHPQASCSCVHCCNNHQNNHHFAEKVDPSYTSHSMSPCKSELHSRESLGSGNVNSHKLSSSTSHPQKVVVAKKRARVWRPIAGGAPVITCSNCFELLRLPKKHVSPEKVQQKMKCGACSSIILFEVCSNGLVSSVSERIHVETNQDSIRKEDEDKIFLHGGSNGSDTNASFNDCESVADPIFSPKEEKSKSFESEGEKNSDNTLSSEHGFESSDLPPVTEVETTVNSNSFSPDVSDNYSDNVAENKTQTSEVAKAVTDESRQSSLKEIDTMATEMDVSVSELPNSLISQESEETSKGDHSKDISSNFGDFTDSSEILEVGLSQVFVNGHLIPDREVKKAEKLAGPIQPGEYWYDTIAGFWGVMGHPCLGLIMPNIEEFNYPIPSNCAAGNTDIYVNGRELYKKDLDLLIRRGLPHTRNRSYIIDISGKVVDELTGQELDSLGKLAPTVEKAKHGFGMKVPKFIARLQS